MRSRSIVLVTSAVLLLTAGPALAQVEKGQQEIGGFVGGFFGDNITESNLSGMEPELDDDVVFGVRYDYFFSPRWGIDVSFEFSPNTITDVPATTNASLETDADLSLVDVSAIWNFTNPESNYVGYLIGGAGFASVDIDDNLVGMINGTPVNITDDSGFTANFGVGARLFINKSFEIRVEGRYRYIDALLDDFDDSLNTFESTIGAGWVF